MSKEIKLLWIYVLFISLCFCIYATRELQFRKVQTDFIDLVIVKTERLNTEIFLLQSEITQLKEGMEWKVLQ